MEQEIGRAPIDECKKGREREQKQMGWSRTVSGCLGQIVKVEMGDLLLQQEKGDAPRAGEAPK